MTDKPNPLEIAVAALEDLRRTAQNSMSGVLSAVDTEDSIDEALAAIRGATVETLADDAELASKVRYAILSCVGPDGGPTKIAAAVLEAIDAYRRERAPGPALEPVLPGHCNRCDRCRIEALIAKTEKGKP